MCQCERLFFHKSPAPCSRHNILCKHHCPWGILWNLIRQPVHHHRNKQEGARGVIPDALPPPPWPHRGLAPLVRGLFLSHVLLLHHSRSPHMVALSYLSDISRRMSWLHPVKTDSAKWPKGENVNPDKRVKLLLMWCCKRDWPFSQELAIKDPFLFSCLSFY